MPLVVIPDNGPTAPKTTTTGTVEILSRTPDADLIGKKVNLDGADQGFIVGVHRDANGTIVYFDVSPTPHPAPNSPIYKVTVPSR
jgi:hypothetical protein